jgi:8-oxo-dGTP diphosphatase
MKESKTARPDSKLPSPEPPRQLMDVSAALIFHQEKLLITRRKAGSHLGGLWEFPGGKREPDETFEQCLAREIREELGIEIAVGKLFEEITHDYETKSVHLKFFLCQWIQGEPQPLECDEFKWIRQGELAEYSFPPADARLLQKLNQPGVFSN